MSFFESDVVRAEMAELSELQEEIYNNVFKFPTLSKEDQKYHVGILERLIEKQKVMYTRLSLSDDPAAKKMKDDILEKLLEKQRVMYTRLSLSDDPEAKEMKKRIIESAAMFGLPENIDMNIFFNNMSQAVGMMKQQIDK